MYKIVHCCMSAPLIYSCVIVIQTAWKFKLCTHLETNQVPSYHGKASVAFVSSFRFLHWQATRKHSITLLDTNTQTNFAQKAKSCSVQIGKETNQTPFILFCFMWVSFSVPPNGRQGYTHMMIEGGRGKVVSQIGICSLLPYSLLEYCPNRKPLQAELQNTKWKL